MLHSTGVEEVSLLKPSEKLFAGHNEILILEDYELKIEWARDE
jgi:hypothetical protein